MNERLQRATEAALDGLRRAGRLLPVSLREPEMPQPFAETLARVLAVEEVGPRRESLERHYLELMPKMRAEQLCTSEKPAASFFQARFELSRLPKLRGAVERLQSLLASVGAPPVATDGETLGELYQTTFYGGFMPLLYGAPADLALFARARGSIDQVIDHYLSAPLIHELTHLGRRRRVFPLYLDECVAGWLGVTVLPQFAFPDEDEGIYAAPWFAQVGQALERVAGRDNILRAHAGVIEWAEALPKNLYAALERLGWEDYLESRRAHFLSDNFHPEPWLKLIFLAHAGQSLDRLTLSSLGALAWSEVPPGDESPLDLEIVQHALRAMCLHNYRDQNSFRTRMRPPPAPITIDPAQHRVSTAACEVDPAPLAYFLPPPVAARLPHGYMLELTSLTAIDEAARAIFDGAAPREGAGYRLSARPRPAPPA